jgi:hypothetical protein
MSGLLRNLWARLSAPAAPKPPQAQPVIIHDPEAKKAHDLDDPFFDRKVQTRIADMIAHAGQHQKK